MTGIVRFRQNAFGRWIVLNPELDDLAWSGSDWAFITKEGLPTSTQVSNLPTLLEAIHYAERCGLKIPTINVHRPTDEIRVLCTPEQIALFDWTYEFTRDPSRSTMLIGAFLAVAVHEQSLDFWQVLAKAKEGVAFLMREGEEDRPLAKGAS